MACAYPIRGYLGWVEPVGVSFGDIPSKRGKQVLMACRGSICQSPVLAWTSADLAGPRAGGPRLHKRAAAGLLGLFGHGFVLGGGNCLNPAPQPKNQEQRQAQSADN